MMEAAKTSETLINVYQTTRRYNPEDSYLRIHRREDLKSCLAAYILLSSLVSHSLLTRYQLYGVYAKCGGMQSVQLSLH
jgi:hypothetical protein